MNDMPRRKSIAKFMVIVEQYTIYLFIYFLYLDSRIPLKVKIFSKSAGRMLFLQLESFRAIFVLSKRIRVCREKNLLSKLKWFALGEFTIHKMHTHKVAVLDFQECLFVLTEYFLFHLLQGLHLTVFVFQFVCLNIYAYTHTHTVRFSWFVYLC